MHILGTQTLVVKLYDMNIQDTQNISSNTLLHAYSRYSEH